MTYSPRLSAPSTTNKYYISTKYGGYNPCILIYSGSNSCLPNCVGYANGRSRELSNNKAVMPTNNAENWWSTTSYSKGQEPKLGAIMCWRKGKANYSADGAGHVAVVERIEGNKITCSNSNYKGTRFFTLTFTKGYYNFNGLIFQGFIYNPYVTDTTTSTVNINVGGSSTDTNSSTFKGTFTADQSLNIRSQCTTASTVLATMAKGEECNCDGSAKLIPNDGGRAWMKVTYKGITGFAYSRYLTKKASSTTTTTSDGFVKGASFKIKEGTAGFLSGTFQYTYTIDSISNGVITFTSKSGVKTKVNKSNCYLVTASSTESKWKVGAKFKIKSGAKSWSGVQFLSGTYTYTYTINSISSNGKITFYSKSGTLTSVAKSNCYLV